MKYEKCPECGKKGLHEIGGSCIQRAMTGRILGDKECRYCNHVVKYIDELNKAKQSEGEPTP